MLSLDYLPRIVPALAFCAFVVLGFFATGRGGIPRGWRLQPASRREWLGLWFHSLEAAAFCFGYATMAQADLAPGLLLGTLILLFVSSCGPIGWPLRWRAWIVLILVLVWGLLPVAIRN